MPTDEHRNLHPETLRFAAAYAEFDALLQTISLYLPANAERLEITAEQQTAITTMLSAWVDMFNKYVDPNQRTRAVIRDIGNLYKRDLTYVHDLQQSLKNNVNITVTGADRTAFGIHEDKTTRTPVPRQEVAPNIEQVDIKHQKNTFQTSYPDTAGNAHIRLPAYNQLLSKSAFPAEGVAPTDADFKYVTISGRSKFTVQAPPDTPVGAKGYVKCCYVNSRGEMGPESPPFEFIVN